MLIAQLSDLHVRAGGHLYKGVVDSNEKLDEAIEHLQRLDRRPDLVLITGDLVDEGHPDEYAAARELLQRLSIPFFVIPGNHDDRENFRAAFADHEYLPKSGPLHYCVEDYPVRIVALDSSVPGKHHGLIDAEGLRWTAAILDQASNKPTLLMLHHPPFACGIPYMDDYRCMASESLKGLVDRFEQVKIVLCGHVHRSMFFRWTHALVCSCPSTATEIALQFDANAEPKSHAGPRGYMLHLWNEAHHMVSHSISVGEFAGPYPFA